MRSIILSLFFIAFGETLLEFDYSVVYDMQDFRGTPEYPITICAPGCRVYLTYVMDEEGLGDQYLKDFTVELDDERNITFYDLNRLQLENGEKGFFDVPTGTAQFVVRNPNNNGATRPLALMVVKKDAPSFETVQVYDAANQSSIESTAARIVLMGIDPFTVNAAIEGDYNLTVKTSPFDMLSIADCEHVLKQENAPNFSASFNSPVISFFFDSAEFTAKLNIDFSFPDERSIDEAGYVASPGYIGCADKSLVFRSESYINGVTSFNQSFLVSGNEARHIVFHGDLNTDDWAPILLYNMDANDAPLTIIGKQSDNNGMWDLEMDTSKFSLVWDGLEGYERYRNESFMIRYATDENTSEPSKTTTTLLPATPTTTVASTTTTTAPRVPTSTTVPQKTSSSVPIVPTIVIEPVESSTVVADTSTDVQNPVTSRPVTDPTTSISPTNSIIVSIFCIVTWLLQ